MAQGTTMMLRALVLSSVFLGVLLGAAAGFAQDAPLDAALAEVVDSARSEGLPADYLVSKVREGHAKRVPPERLLVAIKGMREELASAHRAIGGWSDTTDWPPGSVVVAAAQALRSGMALDDLRDPVLTARGRGIAAERILLLASDLKLRGVPPAAVIELAGAVARRGEPGDEGRVLFAIERLRGQVGGDVAAAAKALQDQLRRPADAPGLGRVLDTLGQPPGWKHGPGGKGADVDSGGGPPANPAGDNPGKKPDSPPQDSKKPLVPPAKGR